MGNPNLSTINPSNPQQVLIKNTTLTFLGSGNIYDLNDPDLQNFITNTQFDKQINNLGTIFNFLNDMNYDINYGDKKSEIFFNKDLINQYTYQKSQSLNNQLGSGLNGETSHESYRENYRELHKSSSSNLNQTN